MAILITGGFGCIGAETAKWLLGNTDESVIVASRSATESRIKRVFHGCDLSRLTLASIDVRNQAETELLLERFPVTGIVHLAGLQTPDCNANRDLGLQVNLAGTQTLIESIKSSGHSPRRFIFASSAAVYGPRNHYPGPRVSADAIPLPVNVYGVWKLAGEHVTRIFHEETGVPSLSIRPAVLFGPGRDAGLTASPTTAMKCLALGLPYRIPFHSRQDYLFAPDVGASFGHALMDPFHDGYGAFNLPSHTLDSHQMQSAIAQAASDLKIPGADRIEVGQQTVPFICDLDSSSFLKAFPDVAITEVPDAVRQSLTIFRNQVAQGWLTPADVQG